MFRLGPCFGLLCLTSYYIYIGAELAEHFSQLGYSIPPSFNPADYLLDLISTDLRSKEAGADSSARVASIVEAWASSRSDAAGRTLIGHF